MTNLTVADRVATNDRTHGRHPCARSASMDPIAGQICWFRRRSSHQLRSGGGSEAAIEGHCRAVDGRLADFQSLLLKRQIDAVPRTAGERFAANTGKIDACSILRTRSVGSKRRKSYARKARCKRNSNFPQASSLVSDCEVSSHRSPLPTCKGQKELSAFVLPL
jgi:hypothetical protein